VFANIRIIGHRYVPQPFTRLSSPAEDLLHVLKQYSGDKLTCTEDLAILLEAAMQHNDLGTLEELSFHAKFVANASKALQRPGTSEINAARLSEEVQSEISTVMRLARILLTHSPVGVQDHFSSEYFTATPAALHRLFALCYDLSWYKNWLIDNPGVTPAVPVHPQREKRFTIWRCALSVMLVGSVFWLGGFVIRATIADDLLIPGTMQFDNAIPPAVERHLYRVLAGTAIPMVGGYLVVLISSVIFLRTSPLRIREHGWLMMSALLLYMFIPVEVFAMRYDVRMIIMEFFSGGDLETLREIFLARVGALAGTPFIAMLCYFTIFVLAVFQPFRRTTQQSS
jgi:hypothetical protein